MKQSANLDLLRTVAVLLVLVSHAPHPLGLYGKPGWDLEYLGHFGVTMFFIHTSLVLSMSMARLEQQGERLVASFYIRRAFRIYPLSILTVLLVFALHIPPWFHTPFAISNRLYFWSNLLLFQNLARQPSAIGPLWSLPYEVQMYLVLPLIYFAGKKLRNPVVLGFSGLVLYIVDLLLARRFGNPQLFEYAPWFTLGAALYFTKPKGRWPAAAYCVFLGLFIGAAVLWHETLGDYYAAALLFCLGFPMFREVQNRWLRGSVQCVARYSYGLYLSHVPIVLFVSESMDQQPAVLRTAVFVVLIIAAPVILYHAVEKPFVDVGVRLATRTRRQPMALDGPEIAVAPTF
jgi:peptidoglycan/LPS O-acetylase OafA/YrhL